MNIEQFRDDCLCLPYVTEDMPFDDTVVVFRLKNKIFACVCLDKPHIVVLKCDAEYAQELRSQYYCIEGAWHWNKRYWNQITLTGELSDLQIRELIRHAYQEVNKKLPKSQRVKTE